MLVFKTFLTFLNFLWLIVAGLDLYGLNLNLCLFHISVPFQKRTRHETMFFVHTKWHGLGRNLGWWSQSRRLSVGAELSTNVSSLNSWSWLCTSINSAVLSPACVKKRKTASVSEPIWKVREHKPNKFLYLLLVGIPCCGMHPSLSQA